MLGGIYWKNGSRAGALAGLGAGFLLWLYTLLLPSFAQSGWLPASFLQQGPFAIAWLKPQQLFGLQGLDPISHGLFWSMLANVGLYVGVSLFGRQSALEKTQAALFVDVESGAGVRLWRGNASADALRDLLQRFLGPQRTDLAFARFEKQQSASGSATLAADRVHFAEIELAGAIGAASAHAMIASVVDEEPLGIDEVMAILDETSQLIAYSHRLEQKSTELELASNELKAANARLLEFDHMKDDFISNVTHELRTPLTSIRAFSEILRDHPDLAPAQRRDYLDIVIKESERLTRLINDVLDLAKLESGSTAWHTVALDPTSVIMDAIDATSEWMKGKNIKLELDMAPDLPQVCADRDRLMQVMLNLLSNAIKFCKPDAGRIAIEVKVDKQDGQLQIAVRDNGAGVRQEDQLLIFQKFRQGSDGAIGKPQGTGLGLPISREIISHFGGQLWVESNPGHGARFAFTLPLATPQETKQ
jgi:signal transduction histidine kinase